MIDLVVHSTARRCFDEVRKQIMSSVHRHYFAAERRIVFTTRQQQPATKRCAVRDRNKTT